MECCDSAFFITDSTTNQKRFLTLVRIEPRPVETIVTSTTVVALSIKQEVVYHLFIPPIHFDVAGLVDRNPFDDEQFRTKVGH